MQLQKSRERKEKERKGKGWNDGKMERWKDGRMEGWKDGTKRECQRRKQKNAQSVDNKSVATSRAQTLIAYFAANKNTQRNQR